MSTILVPELLWQHGRFVRDRALVVEGDRIAAIVPAERAGHEARRLPRRALMPGFVNAHSHAFQRLIRGRTQWRPANDRRADFWSWREEMYRAALLLSPEQVEAVSAFCFLEMLKAGYTSVGEFHYLHNDRSGAPYDDPAELARRILAAARSVGIRIALLHVAYATSGIGQPLRPEQRRFATPTLDGFLRVVDALRESAAGDPLVSVGVAPHSIRAVPREWLPAVHAYAEQYGLPLHMHVSEQPAEVDAALAAFGLRPVELLEQDGLLDDRFTAVHATHLAAHEVNLLGNTAVTVCACPTTERDLGDGFLQADNLLTAGARIAIGTDSQSIIDPFEEVRLIEYHERLQRLRRIVLLPPGADGAADPGSLLLDIGTRAGAKALRLDAGRLEAGALADFIAVDLDHIALAGCDADSLAAHLTLGGRAECVSDVWTGGIQRVADRSHADEERLRAAFGVAVRS
ncbi:MAG TPA: formimidoylglutamate deiminase [Longimicrobiales bacterium]|nr:formimidoylglutamate deiminase [Longimicrobiales bacterium]